MHWILASARMTIILSMKQQSQIPFVDLKTQYYAIEPEITAAMKRVFEKGQFIGGEEVEKFEDEFARYTGSKHCIALNSGTDALILGMKALNLEPGSEVIIPANTFFATALAATENGLKPVFVDASPDYGMDTVDLKKKITDRTRAVIPVHLYGQPDDLDAVERVINGKNILLVEDAAQAHGSEYNGKKAGSRGVFGVYSFYPGKNLGAYGDGGAIVTQDDKLADQYRLLREYGSRKKYYHEILGRNTRLDTMQGAILRVKLGHLDEWNAKRRKIAAFYDNALGNLAPHVITPVTHDNRTHMYHVYVVRAQKREELQHYLASKGITTLIHYPYPLHLQTAFSYLGYKQGDLPIAEKLAGEILSLPMYPELTEEMAAYVAAAVKEFYSHA